MMECRCYGSQNNPHLAVHMRHEIYRLDEDKKERVYGFVEECLNCQSRILVAWHKDDPNPPWLKRLEGLRPTQFNKIVRVLRAEDEDENETKAIPI